MVRLALRPISRSCPVTAVIVSMYALLGATGRRFASIKIVPDFRRSGGDPSRRHPTIDDTIELTFIVGAMS